MILVLIALFLICLVGLRWKRKSDPDFFDQTQTNCIRGVFALIIFMSHFNSYFSSGWGGVGDNLYLSVFKNVGQMMVAPFLFISGYGIYLSAQKKKNYIKDFPKNRIFKTYVFFALAVALYFIYNLITGVKYDAWTNILAFTGWTEIGNSNWFMFAILFLYIATYLSALITKKQINNKTIALISLMSLAYIIAMNFIQGGDHWWYDTTLCFAAGLFFAAKRDQIKSVFTNHRALSVLVPAACFAVLFFLYKHISHSGLAFAALYNILSCIFCLLIARVSFSFSFGNPILMFLGAYGFEIYILQRIPHSFLSPLFGDNILPCFFVSLLATLLISIAFKAFTTFIFSPRKQPSSKKLGA